MQRKKKLGEKVIKLLKQGYTPTEITQRMAVSYNYAWKLWKNMRDQAQGEVEAAVEAVQEAVQGLKPGEFIQADTNVDAILNERGSRYGNFLDHARVTYKLKEVARNFAEEKGKTFAVDQCEAMDMIFHKIGRILNGDPNYADSWIDIAGYAQLVADRLDGKVR
jgi:DNA-binding CsgD family transcriptional regulator